MLLPFLIPIHLHFLSVSTLPILWFHFNLTLFWNLCLEICGFCGFDAVFCSYLIVLAKDFDSLASMRNHFVTVFLPAHDFLLRLRLHRYSSNYPNFLFAQLLVHTVVNLCTRRKQSGSHLYVCIMSLKHSFFPLSFSLVIASSPFSLILFFFNS